MFKSIAGFMRDEKGLVAMEYVLLTSLVVAGIAVGIDALSGIMQTGLAEIAHSITGVGR